MGCGCEPRQKQAVSTVWMPNQPCGEDGNHVLFLGNIGVSRKGTSEQRGPRTVNSQDGLFGANDACFRSTWADFGPCPPTNKIRQSPVVLSLMIATGVA